MQNQHPEIILLAHNIRSTYNVGSLFRTAEGFGVSKIIFSGYTPYPTLAHDTRLPHIARKLTDQIHKTALGAETLVPFEYNEQPNLVHIQEAGYHLVALEQSERSTPLQTYRSPQKIALLIGEEVHGIEQSLLSQCDTVLEIPMMGDKESFNVSVATGIALFQIVCHAAAQ